MRIRNFLRDGLKDFSADEIRVMALEAMDGLGLTPGGPCMHVWLGVGVVHLQYVLL